MYAYEIYVPRHLKAAIKSITEYFNTFYGGSTSYDGEGEWYNSKTKLTVKEPVTIIRALTTYEKEYPLKYATEILINEGESSVLITKQKLEVEHVST